MSLSLKILWSVTGFILIASAFALSMWGCPAPTAEIRQSIPVEQFFKKHGKSH